MTTIKRVEVSPDGERWITVLMREVEADVQSSPGSVLPEGYAWEKHDGRWVPVEVVGVGRA
jgi:hypothetical protein